MSRFLPILVSLLALGSGAVADDTGTILGRVVERDGAPIAGARVYLRHRETRRLVTIRSDGNGRFRARGLAPGQWEAHWEATERFEELARRAHPVIALAAGGIEGLDLVMLPVSVSYGQIRDPDGRPMANRTVWMVPERSMHHWTAAEQVRCDGAGFYRMFDCYDDAQRVSSFPETWLCGVFVPGVGYAPMQRFPQATGATVRRDFQLRRGAIVEGQVLAADGVSPVAGAEVTVKLTPPPPETDPSLMNVHQQNFHFAYSGLAERPPKQGYVFDYHRSCGFSEAPPENRPRDAGSNQWPFRKASGTAVAELEVTTDARGRFRFEMLPGGTLEIRASDGSHASEPRLLVLWDGKRQRGVRLLLDR